ncbi:MAG: sulfatase-like hydrolase/transferase, partial [Actinomycetota bacterium]|nr:sulfatase-like hydrolase/transferase [Actinomycetota bacterium]
MPKNVLVLVCDTARADAFEPYGAPVGSTPAVARLAAHGAAVENVFSTACWTLPSHASMFSGLLPRALGLGQAPGGTPHGARSVLEDLRERLLPEVLRQAGWDTRGVSTNLWVSPYSGLSTGFDEFELIHAGARQEQVSRDDLRGRAVWAYEGLRARADDGAGAAERTIRR